MSESIKENTFTPIKQFDCPNCGSALEVFNKRAKYTGCTYCGSLLDPRSEDYKILAALGKPESYPPLTFLEVGMVATFQGKKFQIIARTRWEMDYQERWAEEGETGYSDEHWVYDEWLLLSEQMTYLYLIEDKEGFYTSSEVIPDHPMLPSKGNDWIKFYRHHSKRPIQEIGLAQVVFFEGESNYKIRTEDQIHFASYNYKGKTHIVEYRLDRKTGEYQEIEFFEEEKIYYNHILKAFADNPQAKKVFEKRDKWYQAMLVSVGAMVSFIVLILAAAFWKETPVFEQKFAVDQVLQDSTMKSNVFSVEQNGAYNLKLVNNLSSKSSNVFAVAYVMDEAQNPLRALQANFTGTNTSSESQIVQIDGNRALSIQLFVQKSANSVGHVKFEITKVHMLSRYYVIGAILSMIMIFVFLAMWQSVKS